jgi:excisionase family DNA binding protein
METNNSNRLILTPGLIYTSEQVCIILSICKKTLQNLRDRGQIAHHKLGRKIRYKCEDIYDALNNNRIERIK